MEQYATLIHQKRGEVNNLQAALMGAVDHNVRNNIQQRIGMLNQEIAQLSQAYTAQQQMQQQSYQQPMQQQSYQQPMQQQSYQQPTQQQSYQQPMYQQQMIGNMGQPNIPHNNGVSTKMSTVSKYNNRTPSVPQQSSQQSCVSQPQALPEPEEVILLPKSGSEIPMLTPYGIELEKEISNNTYKYIFKGRSMEPTDAYENVHYTYNKNFEFLNLVDVSYGCKTSDTMYITFRRKALMAKKDIVIADAVFETIFLTNNLYKINECYTHEDMLQMLKHINVSDGKLDKLLFRRINKELTSKINKLLKLYHDALSEGGSKPAAKSIESYYNDYKALNEYINTDPNDGKVMLSKILNNLIKPYKVDVGEENIEELDGAYNYPVYKAHSVMYVENADISRNIYEKVDVGMSITRSSHNDLFKLLNKLHNDEETRFNDNDTMYIMIQDGTTYEVMFDSYNDAYIILS